MLACVVSKIEHITGTASLELRLKRQYLRFIVNCLNSKNCIVKTTARIACITGPSVTNTNILDISQELELSPENLLSCTIPPKLSPEYDESNIRTGHLIKDLLGYRSQCSRDDRENLTSIIKTLCID